MSASHQWHQNELSNFRNGDEKCLEDLWAERLDFENTGGYERGTYFQASGVLPMTVSVVDAP